MKTITRRVRKNIKQSLHSRLFVEHLEERHALSGSPTILLGGSSGNEADGALQAFTWNISDPAGLSAISVEVEKDGAPIYSTTDLANAVGSFNFDSYGVGNFTINVSATEYASQTMYTLHDLGTLGDPSDPRYANFQSQAQGINDAGLVVGRSDDGSFLPDGGAFVYDGAMHNLGTLGTPSGGSNAFDINNNGLVVGDTTVAGGADHAFIYDYKNHGPMTDLGAAGGIQSIAYGVNDAGQVVGRYINSAGRFRSFLYDGTMHDIGSLGGTWGEALAINNLGTVVGYSYLAGDFKQRAYWYDGTMHDLGIGDNSQAIAINDSGQITGLYAPPTGSYHAYLYDGTLHDLGSLAGTGGYSDAFAINNAGQVVGTSAVVGDSRLHGFLYDHGTMRDLNALVAWPAGWYYATPLGINNLGQIAGYAYNPNGSLHAVRLDPIAPPTVSASRNVTIGDDDTAGPEIVLGGSQGTEATDAAQLFSWNVSDPSGLSVLSVVVTRDTGSGPSVIYSTTSTADAVGNFNFDSFGAGTYAINVSATDADSDWPGDASTSSDSRTVDVVQVNHGPSGTNDTVTLNENATYVLQTADFGFSDPDGNNLLAVKIDSLPSKGSLLLNGTPVMAGDYIPAPDIAAGALTFQPTTGESGSPYTSFMFQVQDDGGVANGGVDLDPNPKTITFNVIAIQTLNAAVDIAPDSLNLASNGTITVLVYGTADFEVTKITSLEFAGATAWQSRLVDANLDGRLDLQLKFRTQDVAPYLLDLYEQMLVDDPLHSSKQTATVELTGTLDVDGADQLFAGSDSLNLFLAGKNLRSLLDQLATAGAI